MADVDRGYDVTHALDGHPRYAWQQELGRGTFGTVGLCKDMKNNGSLVAIKLIQRGPNTITDYVESEVLNFRCALVPGGRVHHTFRIQGTPRCNRYTIEGY